ncbi:hypothetical protein G7046_g948 [Stylonectria norvegica]|nr:hypothetical protein G7046_g948 [Stylonectria norvegica]
MAPARRSGFQSPRLLVHKHAQRLLRAKSRNEDDLLPGHERLSSYLIPGLQAGNYTINITQDIETKDKTDLDGPEREERQLATSQNFTAVAARFSLPNNAVHSMYPPQGHEDAATVLPHVVFNDPSFPWERIVSAHEKVERSANDYGRTRTPWLAVFAFTEDELKLDNQYLSGDHSIFQKIPTLQKGVQQGPNFSISGIPVGELKKSGLGHAIAPVSTAVDEDDTTTAEMIFLKRELFAGLFTKRDRTGKPFMGDETDNVKWDQHPYIFHHSLLAHRRDIRNEGMALAAASTEEDSGSYSVVVSHRTGPFSITEPKVVYVHLVSLEGVDHLNPIDGTWPLKPEILFVGMPSLLSWTYICLPPSSPDVSARFDHLGQNVELIRSLKDLPPPKPDQSGEVQKGKEYVLSRIKQGYSLSRYRTQTGEETACFVRGPAVPVDVGTIPLPEGWPETSMTGTNLQILDRSLGLMDITYSSAWHLGRMTAIADQAFTAALFRVRRDILKRAMTSGHAEYAVQQGHNYKSRVKLFGSLENSLNTIGGLHETKLLFSGDSMLRRWSRTPAPPLNMSYHSQGLQANIDYKKAAKEVASTPDPRDTTQPNISQPYDEYNTPFSSDWVVVLRWILDRLFLGNVPPHYVLTDASQLPRESIRFFKIDKLWVDCLIDGALSLGNHTDQIDDPVRDGMKAAINAYLDHEVTGFTYKPPVPKYGCFIRSDLVVKFPDLIITAEPPNLEDGSPILLRHEVLVDGTMMCLFSEMPSRGIFNTLKLAQPPHQQNFIAARDLNADQVRVSLRKAYTVKIPDGDDVQMPLGDDLVFKKSDTGDTAYLWDDGDEGTATELRILLVQNLGKTYLQRLRDRRMPDNSTVFDDDTLTSALMAFQCNNPSWELVIEMDDQGFAPEEPARLLPVHRRNPPSPPRRPDAPVRKSLSRGLPSPEERRNGGPSLSQLHPPPSWRRGAVKDDEVALRQTLRGDDTEVAIEDQGPGDLPTFYYNYWEARDPGTRDNLRPIPMRSGLRQDIIFSIVLATGKFAGAKLKTITVEIPVGESAKDRPTLTETYRGSGATMLSNLRFIPSVKYATEDSKLTIKLMSRSTSVKGSKYPVKRCTDMSFILSGVDICDNFNVDPELFKDGKLEIPLTVKVLFDTYTEYTVQPQPVIVLRDSAHLVSRSVGGAESDGSEEDDEDDKSEDEEEEEEEDESDEDDEDDEDGDSEEVDTNS